MIQRVFQEMLGKPFLRGLLFPYFLFLLAVSAADASTLASYGTNPVTHYLGFVGLTLPIILSAHRIEQRKRHSRAGETRLALHTAVSAADLH